ncbi:GNAT family N-acetyltransferase [Streptomyces cellulosae]|uniref:GNAT family N-acetyltransferase n=1 Tax=Streptomyces cellulosae TaxID=1968 RepID=A0ABW7YCF4_STRCE
MVMSADTSEAACTECGAGEDVERAAHSWAEAMTSLAAAAPGGHWRLGEGGAVLAVTGAPVAALNGVLNVAARPDAAGIAELAALAARELTTVPWSIQIRGEPTTGIVEVAGHYGMTVRSQQPFMLRPFTGNEPTPPRGASVKVRRATGSDHKVLSAALAAGFAVPQHVFTEVASPTVMAAAGMTAYLAEAEGTAVATGTAAVFQDCVGLFNISTLPPFRGRGYARVMTERILREGRAMGARAAYLHTTEAGRRLYESLGFRTVGQWTTFSAP